MIFNIYNVEILYNVHKYNIKIMYKNVNFKVICNTLPTTTQYCLFCPTAYGFVSSDLVRTSHGVTHSGTTPTQARLTAAFQEPVMRVSPKRVVPSKANNYF